MPRKHRSAASSPDPERRTFLKATLGLTTGALAASAFGTARAQPVSTKAHIVIAGGGAAGLTVANRLGNRLDGARITVVEPNKENIYQPGLTLVGAGLKPTDYVRLSTADFVPRDVRWLEERVASFDPDANKLTTDKGTTLDYDFLVVTTGLQLDYTSIEGMQRGLIGQNGIASIYAGPQAAADSWATLQRFAETGGIGLFGRPATEIKGAGAPLKQIFLADDWLRRMDARHKAKLIYNAHNATLFGVPAVDAKLRELFERQDLDVNFDYVLTRLDPGTRVATFRTPDGLLELEWDFINVVPPMRAPDAVRNSPLAWSSGPFAAGGWLAVDKESLQHLRFPNVFGVGDVNGIPKGKTAASVKGQAPVAVDHLVGAIASRPSRVVYNGYTSCPLITRIGSAMLVEFNYNGELVPSFPFIDPLTEHWAVWAIEEMARKPTYLAMLHGLA